MIDHSIIRPIHVLIVDDHPVLRSGLEAMLRAEGTFQITASVSHARDALVACHSLPLPDIVLMDVRMPECDGFSGLTLLLRQFPKLRILMLAGVPLKHEVERARAMGACGYLPKSADHHVILDAIQSVAKGGTAFMKPLNARATNTACSLTDREFEVLEHLARGHSREDIALALSISPETVKSHMKAILPKLHAADRTEAVARAFELGLLQV